MLQPIRSVNQIKRPGPQGRWMADAARDLGVSLPHLWLVANGRRRSQSLSARIEVWRAAHPN